MMTNKRFFGECARVSRALERVVLASELLTILRVECKVKRREVATVLGTKKARIAELTRGKVPAITHYDELMNLRDVVVILLRTLSPIGAGQWMRSENRLLKCSPIDAMRAGRFRQVREAAESYVAGNYI